MNRLDLIQELKQYFDIRELVCQHCYNVFKENAWQFLSTELLSTLYTLRTEVLNKPMNINNWHKKGSLSQRGLRCNMCSLVKSKTKIYLSAHIQGKAIDFNVKNLTIEETKNLIRQNKQKFEYPVRLEANTTTWCHIDCYTSDSRDFVEFNG